MTPKFTAFRPLAEASFSSPGVVVDRLATYLTKNLGEPFYNTTDPVAYENDYGTFVGFFIRRPRDNKIWRVNFLVSGKAGTAVSVDVFAGAEPTPAFTYEIDPTGNVVDLAAALLEIADDRGQIPLTEAVTEYDASKEGRYQTIFDEWRKTVDVSSFQGRRSSVIYPAFLKEDPKYNPEVPRSWFITKLRDLCETMGVVLKDSEGKVIKKKKGRVERVIADESKRSDLETLAKSLGWQAQFDRATKMIAGVFEGVDHACIIYGPPGQGKSESFYQVVREGGYKDGVDYKYYRGTFKTVEDLLQVLYNNGHDPDDNRVIVFDDFDPFKLSGAMDVLKGALERPDVNRPREISAINKDRKQLKGAVPQKFDFYSPVIIISNKTKEDWNEAITSRVLSIEIKLSPSEMIEKIEMTLHAYNPAIPMETKLESFEFLKEWAPAIGYISYRHYEKVIKWHQLYHGGPGWKEAAAHELVSSD